MHTLLLLPSFHLNMSLTRLKNTFRETANQHSFERKNLTMTWVLFNLDNPDQIFVLLQNLLWCIHSFSCPHSIWTSPWLDWKTLFVKLHTDTLLNAKFDNDMSTFFVDNPDQKFLLFQFSELTRMHTLLLLPSFHLNKSLTRLKNTFRETAYRHSFERKTWQWHEYFLT